MKFMLDDGPIVALGLNSPYEVGEAAVRVILGYLNDGTIPDSKTLQLEPTLVTPKTFRIITIPTPRSDLQPEGIRDGGNLFPPSLILGIRGTSCRILLR